VLLARALLEKGDREGALAAAERALELSPANEAALALRTGLVD
jgi:tetratricopeptide (TPR) repeat protein